MVPPLALAFNIALLLTSMVDIDMDTKNIVSGVLERHNLLNKMTDQHTDLMETLVKLDIRVGRMTKSLSQYEEYDMNMSPVGRLFLFHLGKFHKYTVQVDNLFNSFRTYSANVSDYDSVLVDNYARSVTGSHNGSVNGLIFLAYAQLTEVMNIIIINTDHVNKFILCSRGKSAEQFLLDLYMHTLLMEGKALLMVSFSLELLENSETVRHFFDIYEDKAKQRFDQLYKDMRKFSKEAMNEIHACDSPYDHIGNKYAEFVNVKYGLVIRRNVNRDCEDFDSMTHQKIERMYEGCSFNNTHIAERSCHGRLESCAELDVYIVKFCFSNSVNRKYESITYEDDDPSCPDGTGAVIMRTFREPRGTLCAFQYVKMHLDRNPIPILSSMFKGVPTPPSAYCAFCRCTCHDVRTMEGFAIMDIMSDIDKNRVITGLRFRKVGNLITLDIHESALNSKGFVIKGSGQWKLTQPIEGLLPYSRTLETPTVWSVQQPPQKEGMIVTGVRLGADMISGTNYIHLQMHLSRFDPITKNLVRDRWSTLQRDLFVFKDSCIRTREERPTLVDMSSNLYKKTTCVKFQVTAHDAADSAQSLIPFFDTRDVVSSTSLRSVGILFKTDQKMKSGGYLAPILYSTNNIEMAKYDTNFTVNWAAQQRSTGISVYLNTKQLFFITSSMLVCIIFQ